MSLFDRVKLSADHKHITITELEQHLGFSPKSLYKWKTSAPSIDKVILVASYLQVSLSWLATGNEEQVPLPEDFLLMDKFNQLSNIDQQRILSYIHICLSTYSKETSDQKNHIIHDEKYKYFDEPTANTIPILGYVAAGTPIEGINLPMGYLQNKINADYALVAKGGSMEPVIKDQEYIFVRKTSVLDSGDIGIFYINGEVTCKEFHKTDSELVLKSLNSSFKPFKFSLNSLENSMIQGKVILSDEQKARLENF